MPPTTADAGVWGTRTNTPDSLQNIKYSRRRHNFDERCETEPSFDVIYDKRMPSALFQTPLPSLLVRHKIDTVVVSGESTSGCVPSTAVEALIRGYRTIVPIGTAADMHESYCYANLTVLQLKYADVEPVQAVIVWMEAFDA